MNKPILLYITELFPLPPTSGAKIKSINTIQTLSKKFNIVLVCFTEQKISLNDLVAVKKFVTLLKVFSLPQLNHPPQANLKQLLKNYWNLKPYFLYQFYSAVAERYILRVIAKLQPTVIHIDHLNMAQYLPQQKHQTWVLEEHNLEHQLAWDRFIAFPELRKTKLFLWLEYLLIARFEKNLMVKFDHIFAISRSDASLIKKLIPTASVSIQTPVYPITKIKKRLTNPPHLLFIGDLTWHPNRQAVIWFVQKVWPLILKKMPAVQFDLVGTIETDLAAFLVRQPGLKVWGFQKHLDSLFAQAQVFILPFLVGGGVRLKALTALAQQIPIVSTPIGVRGLEGQSGRDYLVATNEADFAKNVMRILAKPKLAQRLAVQGKNYLQKKHSPKNNQQFLAEYERLI